MNAMLAALLAFSVLTGQSTARLSQHGSVTQQIGATTITVDYNRPVARGRDLFGALVPYDRVWCPGADECTTITTSTEITVQGKTLAAGTYTVWAKPGRDTSSIIFNKAHPTFHTQYFRVADQDVLTIEVKPHPAAHMETLAFYFAVVDGHHAELDLHWGTVAVPIAIDVP
jgi:Protein of unknown function (DUF2911)